MKRRRFLGLAGASAVAGLAGCGGSETTGESIEDHPAAADLVNQPRQGDLNGHVVLAFEDPSCERCAAFHENTVPTMRSNLVDPGLGPTSSGPTRSSSRGGNRPLTRWRRPSPGTRRPSGPCWNTTSRPGHSSTGRTYWT
ncbi:hypothetical protein [Haloarcula regularis]|uniref:hypothetical protein n=1 Tax=Haloarcula regularis TaxID=3033392 RepID=UPI0023E7E916|nr:hypothetical protein [Halomicroarcula sp. SYNS111]